MWRAIIELFTAMFRFIGRGNRIEKRLNRIEVRLLRLEIISAMRRKDTQTVCDLYDIYVNELHSNSYMKLLVEDYLKKQKRSKKC